MSTPTAELEFFGDDARAGFRLDRLEVLNWGTFDNHVWALETYGDNALVTGDIGSGKSTLVDALTTLMVPHQRITYNRAAGADSRERTLASYVRGDYKSERGDSAGQARAIALRKEGKLSVVIAGFKNEGYDQRITLAQALWLKPGKTTPERIYVVAERELSVRADFTGFGEDPAALKKRLRADDHIETFDAFTRYESHFRQRLGIGSSQALNLFYQTISLKSVADLTGFVREHMLDTGDIEERIDELRKNFDNLNAAHQAVVKSREQIQQLTPLVADGRELRKQQTRINDLEIGREALPAWFAAQHLGLLAERLAALRLERDKLADRISKQRGERQRLRDTEAALQQQINEAGGGRLREIEREVKHQSEEETRRKDKASQYSQHAQTLELESPRNEHGFHSNRQELETLLGATEQSGEALEKAKIETGIALNDNQKQREELGAEITSLRSRRSNIPRRQLAIRAALCAALDVPESDLPFAGELIEVAQDAAPWRGALERLLHNFGLSLLVPDKLYKQVSHYVDQTHLGGKLVYFSIGEQAQAQPPTSRPQQVIRKLRIKPDAAAASWLAAEISRRFDHICCESLAEFHKVKKALSQSGQIKTGGSRHEKDDRHRVDDRSRWILGWDNADKLAALAAELQRFEREQTILDNQRKQQRTESSRLEQRRAAINRLLEFASFEAIDWRAITKLIDALHAEARELEESSDVLQSLRTRLAETQRAAGECETDIDRLSGEHGKKGGQIETYEDDQANAETQLAELPEAERDTLFAQLAGWLTEAGGAPPDDIREIYSVQRQLGAWLTAEIEKLRKRAERLTEKLLGQMNQYRQRHPVETGEIDANAAALEEYAAMLDRLQREDLPRHETTFSERLREGAINDVAHLSNGLDLRQKAIRNKIAELNRSLHEIDYDTAIGSCIELVAEDARDQEIDAFRADLRRCIEHSLDSEALYSEQKFHQVKALVDRFNGRDGLADADRGWRRKVADVRNWFEFSARELYRADGSEREYYTGSSGKSGGQKEKLAYTILAASLAYQFGLKAGETRSRSFRFVVIDEAFGRGSDDSARYGLRLFEQLNLQVLIVTPLQKIHVIEDHVQSVHYIHNQEGRNSQIRSLTIRQYRDEKAAHAAQRSG